MSIRGIEEKGMMKDVQHRGRRIAACLFLALRAVGCTSFKKRRSRRACCGSKKEPAKQEQAIN